MKAEIGILKKVHFLHTSETMLFFRFIIPFQRVSNLSTQVCIEHRGIHTTTIRDTLYLLLFRSIGNANCPKRTSETMELPLTKPIPARCWPELGQMICLINAYLPVHGTALIYHNGHLLVMTWTSWC